MPAACTTLSRRLIAPLMIASVLLAAPSIVIARASAGQAPAATPAPLPSDVRWAVALQGEPLAGAAIADGHVFVPVQPGIVVAHRAADGTEAWRATLSAVQPLAALDGLLFVAAGDALHALRISDGRAAWRTPTGTLAAPLLAQDGWVIASSGTQILALRASDGTVVWRRDIARILQPSIEGDRLYLPLVDGRIQSLVLATGADRWVRRLGGAPTEVLAFADRVFAGSADRHFYALDARDGSISWRYRVGAALRGRPAFAGTLVFAAALDNLVRAFDRADGARRWDGSAPYRPTAGPLLVGTSIILSGPARELSTFDTATGAPGAKLALAAVLAAPLTTATLDGAPVIVTVTGDASVGWTASLLGRRFGLRVEPLTSLPGELLPMPRMPLPPK